MKGIRMLAAILAAGLCLAAAAVRAEVTAVNTENNGKIIQTVWTDEAGNPVPGPEGYASVQYSYKKDETTERYFDAAGNPYETSGGYCGRRVTVDGKGRVLQIEYLDESGNRTLNTRGYGMVTVSYYGFGEERMTSYYGLGKKPVMVPSLGYASVYNEYSNRTMTARTFRDEKGNPVDGAEGYAVVKQKVNKKFQVIRIRYEHADGTPATGPDGWYRCILDRDDAGRITKIQYFDTREQLTDRGADYAWEEREYQDDRVLITHYDLQGNKAPDAGGVATRVQQMQDDRIVKESFLDAGGTPVTNALGVYAVLYTYDFAGRIETVRYQNAEGEAMLCREGYAGYRDTLDETGRTLSRTFLGVDGLPGETGEGYSEIRYDYDGAGRLAGVRYFSADGAVIQKD